MWSNHFHFFMLLLSCCCCIYNLVKCDDAVPSGYNPATDWWKRTIVYQIYPRSFQDSDGDGVGDLRGIISRLDHFRYLNVETIWLSPVYRSPMVDFGYDVEDFVDIDPIFGTLDDFDELVSKAHSLGLKILMDFIPNHSSDRHRWFVESRKGGKDNPYSDYYVWHDGKLLENGTRVPPNNWVSCFTGPAWTWDEGRKQYYLHQFVPEQPDLNYRNPKVREEMKNVLQFWLDRDIDGFRVDAIATMFETEDIFQDEPTNDNYLPHEEFYFNHIYTRNQPEIHDVVHEWRLLFDEHDAKTGRHTFMVTEVYEGNVETMKYYFSGADMPFNFHLIHAKQDCRAACFRELIDRWLLHMPDGKWPNFVLGNHDRSRVSKRRGPAYVNAMNVLLLTLPGTPTTYYGEEIGLNEIEVSYEDTQDPWGKNLGPELYRDSSRDPCRAPMQWDDSVNAGFSSALKTWLPVHPDYKLRNVKAQKSDSNSPLSIYRKVAKLRAEHSAFHSSHMSFLPGDDDVIAYVRFNPNDISSTPYLVAINVGNSPTKGVGASEVLVKGFDYTRGTIELDTLGNENILLPIEEISLKPGQAVIVRLVAGLGKQEL
jgi:alpha-glucosidase